MPRVARLTYPGGFYHIYNRGLNKEQVFCKASDKDNYFMQVSRYIHLNPIVAHLVNDPLKYPYSSLAQYAGESTRKIINLSKVTALLGERKMRISEYLRFVMDGINLDLSEYNPFENTDEVVGSNIFASHRKIARYVPV